MKEQAKDDGFFIDREGRLVENYEGFLGVIDGVRITRGGWIGFSYFKRVINGKHIYGAVSNQPRVQ